MITRCRGIRGFSRITPEQINRIRTMPGSSRTIGLALGIAPTSVSRYRRPGSSRIPDQVRDAIRPAQGTGREIAKRFGASQISELRIGTDALASSRSLLRSGFRKPLSGLPTAY